MATDWHQLFGKTLHYAVVRYQLLLLFIIIIIIKAERHSTL